MKIEDTLDFTEALRACIFGKVVVCVWHPSNKFTGSPVWYSRGVDKVRWGCGVVFGEWQADLVARFVVDEDAPTEPPLWADNLDGYRAMDGK